MNLQNIIEIVPAATPAVRTAAVSRDTRPAGPPGLQGETGPQGLPAPEGNAARKGLQALWGNGALRVFPAPAEKEVPRVVQGTRGEQGLQGIQGIPGERGPAGERGLPAGRILPMPVWSHSLSCQRKLSSSVSCMGRRRLTSLPTDDTITLQPGYVLCRILCFPWQHRSPEIIFRYFPL